MRHVLALALLACGSGEPESRGFRDPADAVLAPINFEPEPAGVTDLAVSSTAHHASGDLERGRACVVADFDGDSRLDLYYGNPGDPSAWLRNVTPPGGPLAFIPMQRFADVELLWGATAGDIDNDGDIDLFASVGGNEGNGADMLFLNDGHAVFVESAAQAGVTGGLYKGVHRVHASAGATMVDFDNDGHLDIWVNVNVSPSSALDVLETDPDDPVGENVLWHNRGDGTFADVTRASGLRENARTRHSSWLDVDGDGDLDLYENNFQGANRLWRNQLVETGAATFTRIPIRGLFDGTNMSYPLNSFASAAADFNQDGWEDLMVFARGWPAGGPHPDGHALFLNVEGRGFVEVSREAGFNAFFDPYLVAGEGTDCGDVLKSDDREADVRARGVMGSTVADLNADGVPDILVGNGGPSGGMYDQLFLSTGLVRYTYPEAGIIAVPQYLDGSRHLDFPAEQDPALAAYGTYPYKTHGICVADLDDDGGVEVVVTNGGPSFGVAEEEREPNRIFKLDFGSRRWLKVVLVGDGQTVARSAFGARVDAQLQRADGSTWTVMDRLRGSNGFSSQHGPELILGLGDAEVVQMLTVTWTDGTTTVLRGLEPNQKVLIER